MSNTSAEAAVRVLAGEDELRLLTSFFVLYKTARIVAENNATFRKQAVGFYRRLAELMEDTGDISFKMISGRYFVNERMVRFDDLGLSGAASIQKEWKTLGIGGVIFNCPASQSEIEQFFVFMARIKPGQDNVESLSEQLKTAKLAGVQLLSAASLEKEKGHLSEEMRRQFRTAARSTFFTAMSVVQEVVVNTVQNREINISKTKRVVHTLIDHITRDESSLIELAAIKDYDDYTYAHSTNVCVYCLTLGVRLGLDRPRLSQLGFSALFHDIGKVKLPKDLIHKPDAFDENDWIQMQRHPLLGVKTILRNLKLGEHTARAVRGALEHHINADFTGYPSLHYQKRPMNLFSRIISIADTFDALTSGRVYLKKSIPPEEVLRKMHYQMKVKFDAFLLKIFNDIIGIYPAGTVVLLTTDEIALVLTINEHDRARPYVKIVGNRSGLLATPEWIDLSLPEYHHRKIVRRVEPERYGLNVKDFILRD